MLMQSWMLHQPFDVEARKCRKHRNCMECIGSLLFKPWLYISSDSNGVDSYLNSLEVKEFFSLHTSNFSRIVSTNLSESLSASPDRCGISRCWLNSLIRAQVCRRPVTMKRTQCHNLHVDCKNVHLCCCPKHFIAPGFHDNKAAGDNTEKKHSQHWGGPCFLQLKHKVQCPLTTFCTVP